VACSKKEKRAGRGKRKILRGVRKCHPERATQKEQAERRKKGVLDDSTHKRERIGGAGFQPRSLRRVTKKEKEPGEEGVPGEEALQEHNLLGRTTRKGHLGGKVRLEKTFRGYIQRGAQELPSWTKKTLLIRPNRPQEEPNDGKFADWQKGPGGGV